MRQPKSRLRFPAGLNAVLLFHEGCDEPCQRVYVAVGRHRLGRDTCVVIHEVEEDGLEGLGTCQPLSDSRA